MHLSLVLVQGRAVDPHLPAAFHGALESLFANVNFFMPKELVLVNSLFATEPALKPRSLVAHHVSVQQVHCPVPYVAPLAFVFLIIRVHQVLVRPLLALCLKFHGTQTALESYALVLGTNVLREVPLLGDRFSH